MVEEESLGIQILGNDNDAFASALEFYFNE
jgi:hypothetical protein